MGLFDVLGALVALYTAWAAIKGEVYAKSGVWGRLIVRAERPGTFWSVIAIYAGLSAALIWVF